jgi:hypothetical protein
MAETQEWHYAKDDQQHGPISSADLKQLVADGSLSPGDLVWKEGWSEWKPAKTVKGLLPQGALGNAPPIPPRRVSPASIQTVTDTADQVSQKLWFLDLRFEQFATPKLIGFVFATSLAALILLTVGVAGYALLNFPVIQAVFIVLVDIVLFALLAVGFRVCLELFLVIFRIAEHLSYLRHLQKEE